MASAISFGQRSLGTSNLATRTSSTAKPLPLANAQPVRSGRIVIPPFVVPEKFKAFEAIYRDAYERAFIETKQSICRTKSQVITADATSAPVAVQTNSPAQVQAEESTHSKTRPKRFFKSLRDVVLAVMAGNRLAREKTALERLAKQDVSSDRQPLRQKLIQGLQARIRFLSGVIAVTSHPISLNTARSRSALPVVAKAAVSPEMVLTQTVTASKSAALRPKVAQFYIQPNGHNLCGVAAINAFLQGDVLQPNAVFDLLAREEFYHCNVGMFNRNVRAKINAGSMVSRAEFCAVPSDERDCFDQVFYLLNFLSEHDFLRIKGESAPERLQEMLGLIWDRLSQASTSKHAREMVISPDACVKECVSKLGGLPGEIVQSLLQKLLPLQDGAGGHKQVRRIFLSEASINQNFVTSLGDRFIVGTGAHYYTVIKSGSRWLRLDSLSTNKKGFQDCNNVFASSDKDLIARLAGLRQTGVALIHA